MSLKLGYCVVCNTFFKYDKLVKHSLLHKDIGENTLFQNRLVHYIERDLSIYLQFRKDLNLWIVHLWNTYTLKKGEIEFYNECAHYCKQSVKSSIWTPREHNRIM